MITIKVKGKMRLLHLVPKIREAAEKGTRELARSAEEEWRRLADQRLNTTKRRYQDAIQMEIRDGKAILRLEARDSGTNWLVNAIERGRPSYDIKPGLMRSPSAKQWSQYHRTNPGGKKANPPFVDVPFRTGAQQDKPAYFRRVTPKSSEWIHPGFKPTGSGGPGPMAPDVVEHVKKEAPKVLGRLLKAVVV